MFGITISLTKEEWQFLDLWHQLDSFEGVPSDRIGKVIVPETIKNSFSFLDMYHSFLIENERIKAERTA